LPGTINDRPHSELYQVTDSSLASKVVAVYARYSSAMQTCTSIDDQVYRCRKYIEDHGGAFRSNLVFSDSATSGASLQRAGFEQLMAAVRGGVVDTIVVEDVSRVSRDMADSAALYRELDYLAVRMIGIADGIDTATKGSKLSFNFKAMMSDFYLEDLRDKTLRGLEGRARQGLSTGGLPFGYASQPVLDEFGKSRGSRIVIDEEQAEVVRRMFKMYVDGYSSADIAGALNQEHVPTPRFKSRHRKVGWIASTVRNILENPAYMGHWSFKKRQWRKIPGTNTRRYRNRPQDEVMRSVHHDRRIVDQDIWTAVQTRRAEVKAKYTRGGGPGAPGKRNNYPLSGLLRCGNCGAPMVLTSGSSAGYYVCGDAKKRRTCNNRQSVREISRSNASSIPWNDNSLRRTPSHFFARPSLSAYVRSAIRQTVSWSNGRSGCSARETGLLTSSSSSLKGKRLPPSHRPSQI
jgi:DNA invertase Pin-like site-specific DNA recombinase